METYLRKRSQGNSPLESTYPSASPTSTYQSIFTTSSKKSSTSRSPSPLPSPTNYPPTLPASSEWQASTQYPLFPVMTAVSNLIVQTHPSLFSNQKQMIKSPKNSSPISPDNVAARWIARAEKVRRMRVGKEMEREIVNAVVEEVGDGEEVVRIGKRVRVKVDTKGKKVKKEGSVVGAIWRVVWFVCIAILMGEFLLFEKLCNGQC
ncbi:hypothetical protein HDU97_006526 [Phlyctochytrium planicorne]|nr:hypothetical protein HDU97_006526 [Phlyctochytrium planicorne]